MKGFKATKVAKAGKKVTKATTAGSKARKKQAKGIKGANDGSKAAAPSKLGKGKPKSVKREAEKVQMVEKNAFTSAGQMDDKDRRVAPKAVKVVYIWGRPVKRKENMSHVDSVVHALYACPGLRHVLARHKTDESHHCQALLRLFEGLGTSDIKEQDVHAIELLGSSREPEPVDFLKNLLMQLHHETIVASKPAEDSPVKTGVIPGGYSPIAEMFGGMLESQIYCHNCLGDRSTKLPEFFVVLEIPMPQIGRHKDFIGISDCLDERFKKTKLEEPQRTCEKCTKKKGEPTPAERVRVQSLDPPPHYPIFALIRDRSKKGGRWLPIRLKHMFKMRFGIQDPKKPWTGIKRRFILYAAVVQTGYFGNRKFGCVAQHSDGWYKFNEDKLMKLGDEYNAEYVKKAEILFYRQQLDKDAVDKEDKQLDRTIFAKKTVKKPANESAHMSSGSNASPGSASKFNNQSATSGHQ